LRLEVGEQPEIGVGVVVRRQILEVHQKIEVGGALRLPGGGAEDVEPRDAMASADRGYLLQMVSEHLIHDDRIITPRHPPRHRYVFDLGLADGPPSHRVLRAGTEHA
jgi:hypothetical protein